jgi:predicted permease
MVDDFVRAVRSLRTSTQLSAAVILSLGLGIGMNTAVFSVVNAVLLQPLAYAHPDELVVVRAPLKNDGVADTLLSGAVFAEVRRSATQLREVAAIASVRQNFTGAGLPAQAQVGWISTNLLSMLGARPALGRNFTSDEPPGRILLSDSFWRRQLGADPAAVGRRVFLDGFAYEIVGVMPRDFKLELPRLPTDIDVWKAPDTWWQNGDIWTSTDLSGGVLRLVGRLSRGDNLEAARAELAGIASQLRKQSAELDRAGLELSVDPLHGALVSRVRSGLWLLLAAAGAVLLIACANVMNLQLVRGQRRRREIALRLAMGASRGRVIRLLILEALVLSAAGGALGLFLCWGSLRVLETILPADLPRTGAVAVDPFVLGFAAILSFGAALLFGLAPALKATRIDPVRELHGGRATGGPGRQWTSGVLISAQIALSLVLLLGLGLLGRSLERIYGEPLGFARGRLLTFTVSLPGARYQRPLGTDRFLSRLETAIEALPGARTAAGIWPLPFSRRRWSGNYEGGRVDPARRGVADYRLVTPGVFETLDASLVEGRSFIPNDSRHTVVVSRSVAQRAFPDESAVGRSVRATPWGGNAEEFQIVGVVDDQRHRSRRDPPADAIYFDSRGWSWTDWEIGMAVRADGDPMTLVEPIRRELARLDPEVPMADVQTMDSLVSRDVSSQVFALSVLTAFAAIALVLAMVGVYGVVSWNVAQRAREIGVRLALGATRGRIVADVVGRGAMAAAAGTVLGLIGSAAAARALAGLLFGVSPFEVDVFLGGFVLLFTTALVAAYIPARRAASMDAAQTLRAE